MWQNQGHFRGSWKDDSFKSSLELWVTRPNLCNKIVSCSTITPEEGLADVGVADISAFKRIIDDFLSSTQNKLSKEMVEVSWRLRKLVPKKINVFSEALEMVFQSKNFYVFVPVTSSFQYDSNKVSYAVTKSLVTKDENMKDDILVSLWSYSGEKQTVDEAATAEEVTVASQQLRDCRPTLNWLRDQLLTNLEKWMKETKDEESEFPVSHSLIDRELYARKYEELKEKYGKKIAQVLDCFFNFSF